jgi:uncharacterized protein (DUF433 family)
MPSKSRGKVGTTRGEVRHPRIAIDPRMCHGKPTVRGTRVPITVLLSAIAGGDELAQVADDYGVEAEDVRAAIAYANEAVESEQRFALRATAS